MGRLYSRREAVEEKNNIKKAITLVLVSIATLALIFFFGSPILGRFATIVSDLGKSGKAISQNDKTPPAPPKFNTYPDNTNNQRLDLSGNSEAGATIKLEFNGVAQEVLANKDGHFSFSLDLADGENSFSATAVDTAGNISQDSTSGKVFYDNKPPTLTIETPLDGAQYIGSKQRQVTIQGKAEAEVEITINERFVSVDEEGKFQFTTTLNEGENKFDVKAKDKAGNETNTSLTLHFVT